MPEITAPAPMPLSPGSAAPPCDDDRTVVVESRQLTGAEAAGHAGRPGFGVATAFPGGGARRAPIAAALFGELPGRLGHA